jgi:glycosyltransferase involved in cell wall biosynthesis
MRVLIANKFFFRNGGSESVMFQEREFLCRSGHTVVDFSMQDPRNLPSEQEAYFVPAQDYGVVTGVGAKIGMALNLIHSSAATQRIQELIKECRPDIVHCHNIYHQLTPSIVGATKRLGVPVVLTLHDYKPVCPVYNRLRGTQPCSACLDGGVFNVVKYRCANGSLARSAILFAEARIQRWMGNYEKVDAFIAPSRFMRDAIRHRVPANRVKLLYNGVDVDSLAPIGTDEGYVLYFGRLSAEKGVETLLSAYENSSWKVVVAGKGPLEHELRRRHPLATFVGHIFGDRLKQVIDGASVIVVPSEWYENCPMSVLEAMACGKPVVGTRMGGIPELVADGVSGYLFEAGNAEELRSHLDILMADDGLRRKMGNAGRQRVKQEFSLARHNEGLLEIYRNVC